MSTTYGFRLSGIMPILIHADIVEQCDELSAWRKSSENRKNSVPGDDRSPPWSWTTYLYHDGTHLAMPTANIMTCLRGAAKKITTKGNATLKSESQSGLLISAEYCEFHGPKGRVKLADIVKIRDMEKFSEQAEACKDLGFSLFAKRAKIGTAKHVRVRPRFDDWSVVGKIEVKSDSGTITPDRLKEMFDIAGSQIGLGDWRPSAPSSPGPFGQFEARLSKVR